MGCTIFSLEYVLRKIRIHIENAIVNWTLALLRRDRCQRIFLRQNSGICINLSRLQMGLKPRPVRVLRVA